MIITGSHGHEEMASNGVQLDAQSGMHPSTTPEVVGDQADKIGSSW